MTRSLAVIGTLAVSAGLAVAGPSPAETLAKVEAAYGKTQHFAAEYSALYLVVDPSTWRVTRTTVVSSNGDTNTFAFTDVVTDKPIPTSRYAFDPRALQNYKIITPTPPAPAAPAPSTQRPAAKKH